MMKMVRLVGIVIGGIGGRLDFSVFIQVGWLRHQIRHTIGMLGSGYWTLCALCWPIPAPLDPVFNTAGWRSGAA